eukprot:8422548-Alexandrium_andersonii.AAC.1
MRAAVPGLESAAPRPPCAQQVWVVRVSDVLGARALRWTVPPLPGHLGRGHDHLAAEPPQGDRNRGPPVRC